MKKILPLFLAGVVFIVALLMMRPEPTVGVVVARRDLPAGHTITEDDLTTRQFPQSLAPEGGYPDPAPLIGQTLRVARTTNDVLYPANLGGEKLELAPDERALAIEVSDSSGLAGLLKPGDRVGLTAVLLGSAGQGTFSKTISGGFRVLYVSPAFQAMDPLEANPPGSSEDGLLNTVPPARSRRADRGTVILAVPTAATLVAYDFAPFGVESATRLLNAIDLLPALDHAQNVELSLFLEPDQASGFITPGLYLPDLVITPGPSPTPTRARAGGAETPTP